MCAHTVQERVRHALMSTHMVMYACGTHRPEFILSLNQLRTFMGDIKCSASCISQVGVIIKQVAAHVHARHKSAHACMQREGL